MRHRHEHYLLVSLVSPLLLGREEENVHKCVANMPNSSHKTAGDCNKEAIKLIRLLHPPILTCYCHCRVYLTLPQYSVDNIARNMPVCCAGETLCGRADVDAGKAHQCMNCGGFAHGVFCCFEWSERSDHGIILMSTHAKGKKSPLPKAMVQHLNSNKNKSDLCFKCLEEVKKK